MRNKPSCKSPHIRHKLGCPLRKPSDLSISFRCLMERPCVFPKRSQQCHMAEPTASFALGFLPPESGRAPQWRSSPQPQEAQEAQAGGRAAQDLRKPQPRNRALQARNEKFRMDMGFLCEKIPRTELALTPLTSRHPAKPAAQLAGYFGSAERLQEKSAASRDNHSPKTCFARQKLVCDTDVFK